MSRSRFDPAFPLPRLTAPVSSAIAMRLIILREVMACSTYPQSAGDDARMPVRIGCWCLSDRCPLGSPVSSKGSPSRCRTVGVGPTGS